MVMRRPFFLMILIVSAIASRALGGGDNASLAKAEFEKGTKFFEAEEYEAALPHFQAAYDLSYHRATSIFALAQCERALKRYDEAIEHFKEYLASKPTPTDAAEVKETLALLEELRQNARTAEPKTAEPKKATGAETPDLEAAPAKPAESPIDSPPAKPESKAVEPPPAPAPEVHVDPPAAPKGQPLDLAVREPPKPPARAAMNPPEEESESVFESPILWIGVGAALVAGVVAIALLARSKESPYGGSTGVIIEPR
jgi:tetratricopeptide repeat protein